MAQTTTAAVEEREHILEDAAEVDSDGFGPSAATSEVVLDVKNLQTHFATRWGTVKAVDGVDYAVRRGETLGVVGRVGFWQVGYGVINHAAGAIASGSHRRR